MTSAHRSGLAAGLLLWACSAETTRDLVQAFPDDPQGVAADVAAMKDPVHQEAVILRLSEAYPGRVGSLCSSLKSRNVREHCERLGERPHLAARVDKTAHVDTPVLERAAGGPSSGSLAFPEATLQRWAQVIPEPGDCQRGQARYHLCLGEQAARAAGAGDSHAAAAACNAARTERMRNDCYFRTAEGMAPAQGGYRSAATLCLGSGAFVHECNGHLFGNLFPKRLEPELAAASLSHSADEVALAWHEIAPALEPLMLDLFWARAAERLMPIADRFGPGLLQELPEQAWPHVRTAMAWRLARCDDPIAALHHAADPEAQRGEGCRARPDGPGNAARSKSKGDDRGLNLLEEQLRWTRDLEGEEEFPAVYFLVQGAGRRATDPDPDVDLVLAGLSVQAHRAPPLDLFSSYMQDERLVVRWTAVRLLAAIAPDHVSVALAAEDPDPRVRRRATLAQRQAAAAAAVRPTAP